MHWLIDCKVVTAAIVSYLRYLHSGETTFYWMFIFMDKKHNTSPYSDTIRRCTHLRRIPMQYITLAVTNHEGCGCTPEGSHPGFIVSVSC